MAHNSKLSSAEQLDKRELKQPYYHNDAICGSTFHGLAYTIQNYIQNNLLAEAIQQVKKCITARENEESKRGSFSLKKKSSHQYAITTLYIFLSQLKNISDNHYYYNEIIPHIIVKFNDDLFRFYILHNDVDIGKIKDITAPLPIRPSTNPSSQLHGTSNYAHQEPQELEEGEIEEDGKLYKKSGGIVYKQSYKQSYKNKRRKIIKQKTKRHKKYKITKNKQTKKIIA